MEKFRQDGTMAFILSSVLGACVRCLLGVGTWYNMTPDNVQVLTKIGLCKGLRELHVDPPIHITSSDVHLFMSALEPGPPYMGAGGNIRRTPSGNGLVQASLPQEEATALRVDDFVRVMRRQVSSA